MVARASGVGSVVVSVVVSVSVGSELAASRGSVVVGASLFAVVAMFVGSFDGAFFLVSDSFAGLPSLTCWIVVP